MDDKSILFIQKGSVTAEELQKLDDLKITYILVNSNPSSSIIVIR